MSDTTLALARRLSHEQPVSGKALAEALGCSRAAVWKHVAALRELGVAVEAQAG
ncbi:MAG: HTH domain-containing protein, partial [Pseudomonadota bacterium]